MSWPQNPNDPARPQPQQPPQPAPGFGPPPAWPPTGEQPQPQQQHPQQQYPQQPPPPAPQHQPHQQPYGQHPYSAPQYAPHQQQPGPQGPYGQYPTLPPAPAPARGRRNALIAAGVVVVLAAAGGIVYTTTHGDHPRKTQAAPAHSASAEPTPTEQGPDLSSGSAKPMIAGWQTQTQEEHGFRYDVPPTSADWKLNSSDIQISYTDKNNKPVVAMSGTAEYREGGCASGGPSGGAIQAGRGQLATIGAQGSGGGTLQVNSRNVAGNWVWAAYGGPTNKNLKVSVGKPVPWKHNGINGYLTRATATNIVRPSACVPPRGVSYGISQRLPDGTISEWVIYADQGVPHALTTAEITKIMDTVRPYNGS